MNIGLTCEICGHKETHNLQYHLKQTHSITTKQYKSLYPNSRTMTGHSSRTLEYWIYKGYSIDEAKIEVSKIQKGNFYSRIDSISEGDEELKKQLISRKQKEASPICIEYWLKKGLSNTEAIKAVKEIQSSRSSKSSRFKDKRHSRDSIDKIRATMKDHISKYDPKKWVKHLENYKDLRSKLEVECYNSIKALHNNVKASVRINNYIADLLINDNLIVEVFGDYWHANPSVYSSEEVLKIGKASDIWNKDRLKIDTYQQLGYKVLVIWEKDWIEDKQAQLEKINSYI